MDASDGSRPLAQRHILPASAAAHRRPPRPRPERAPPERPQRRPTATLAALASGAMSPCPPRDHRRHPAHRRRHRPVRPSGGRIARRATGRDSPSPPCSSAVAVVTVSTIRGRDREEGARRRRTCSRGEPRRAAVLRVAMTVDDDGTSASRGVDMLVRDWRGLRVIRHGAGRHPATSRCAMRHFPPEAPACRGGPRILVRSRPAARRGSRNSLCPVGCERAHGVGC